MFRSALNGTSGCDAAAAEIGMSKHRRAIYVVIPVYNRLDATRECLESLSCQTYKHFNVVLVDDGSTDGTSEYIETNYPEVTILKGDGHLWWTGATNLGVSYALQKARSDDYILTLNNDTVLPPKYLETMMLLAEQAQNALIGSIAFDHNRKDVQVSAGINISWFSAKFTKIQTTAETEPDSFYSVSVLSGRGTLIPARAFNAIGLYDAVNFPQYSADYDFSLRAQRAGFELVLHPRCYLYSKTHLTGISNVHNKVTFAECLKSFGSLRSPNNLKIRFRFGLKNAPPLCRPAFIVCDFFRITLGTLRNQMRNIL